MNNNSSSDNGLTSKDFIPESLGDNKFPSPLNLPEQYFCSTDDRIIFNNTFNLKESSLNIDNLFSFNRPGPYRQIFFDAARINTGIITCGGLCPGVNDVIRSITYSCLTDYKIRKVYGFRHGFAGLTAKYRQQAMILDHSMVHNIHEQGGTILGSSRGAQSIPEMVDTLEHFEISILFIIGGDGSHHGSTRIVAEIKRRGLKIAVIGIPKTIDNDISYIHKTFGFDTAVEEARKAISAAHVEATCLQNGIGLVKLMGRNAGFIAAHATLASGNVNICLIPEESFSLDSLYDRILKRLKLRSHMVIVVAEGVGQDLLLESGTKEYDDSGNPKLKDIGLFLKKKIGDFLAEKQIPHTIKYIDPSYMIRSVSANAVDSSFCLQLGNYAVHAGMAGKTDTLVGYWNQNFCLVPIKLALSRKKMVDINDSLWCSVLEITG